MSSPDSATEPTLVGERVTLRPFAPGDAEAMQAGFDEEGRRRDARLYDGKWVDAVVQIGARDRSRTDCGLTAD